MKDLDKLTIFVNRMKRLGIDIKLAGNYPWIYIHEINGVRVTEKFEGEHGFTIAFLPVRADKELVFTDITEIFKLIRKYTDATK
jgi:hypothetical protein